MIECVTTSRRIGATLTITLALIACSGSATRLASEIDTLEKTGQLPLLDRSNDIKDPDTNNNGIRDDIDAWITAQPITDAQKKAAQQMARVQQAKILVDLSDKSALQML
ncbi:MAG: hypothetical protein Q8Q78_05545, partial [Hydrogenophaga sp.]|nr:hypothetical protein [Hydrogenophaga sp.]